ncbi:hypothetical protein MKW94_027087, partial [Papaver nudicaule]|nr:hypothetical protein [Papaver nudicaule]
MSEKVCRLFRRSQRLRSKNYVFREESLCASNDRRVPNSRGNRESSNSSDDIPGTDAESSEGISSGGPPSPCANVNVPQGLFNCEVVRGNDFSRSVFINDSSGDEDNASIGPAAPDNNSPTSHGNPTNVKGKDARQPSGSSGNSSDSEFLEAHDYGLLGSGSGSPFDSENARVRRPLSIPEPVGVIREQILHSRPLTRPMNETGSHPSTRFANEALSQPPTRTASE